MNSDEKVKSLGICVNIIKSNISQNNIQDEIKLYRKCHQAIKIYDDTVLQKDPIKLKSYELCLDLLDAMQYIPPDIKSFEICSDGINHLLDNVKKY